MQLKIYCDTKNSFFNFFIKRTISHERRRLIHFYQPWLTFDINENIKAKHLMAQTSFQDLGFVDSIYFWNLTVTSNDCLNGKFFDLLPAGGSTHDAWICFIGLIHVLEYGSHWPFMAYVVSSLILLKIVCILINSIVCQVHE